MAPGGVFVVRRGNYTPGGESGAEGQGRGLGNGKCQMATIAIRLLRNGSFRIHSKLIIKTIVAVAIMAYL